MSECERLEQMILDSALIEKAERVKAAGFEAHRAKMLIEGNVGNAVLRAEQDAARHRRLAEIEAERIKAAKTRLKELTSDFGHEGETLQQTYSRLTARKAALEAKPAVHRSAVEDHEITTLHQRIYALEQTGRQQGWLPRDAA